MKNNVSKIVVGENPLKTGMNVPRKPLEKIKKENHPFNNSFARAFSKD
jgi:hypothetical protein